MNLDTNITLTDRQRSTITSIWSKVKKWNPDAILCLYEVTFSTQPSNDKKGYIDLMIVSVFESRSATTRSIWADIEINTVGTITAGKWDKSDPIRIERKEK